jgi:hypothetical protein
MLTLHYDAEALRDIINAAKDVSAKLVPTFEDRGWHVVSVTDPYGCILGFVDRSR